MRRWMSFHRDLGLQLLALYLLLIIPFLVALLVFDRLIGLRIRQDVQTSDLSLARAIAQETELSISSALEAVKGLAGYPSVIAAEPVGMENLFSVIMGTRPDINLIYRLDSDGIMLYHYPTGPGTTVGVDFSFRDYFQHALITRQPLVSQGRISPTTNQAVATAVMPLWSPGGEFLGLIGANIRLESLSETLTQIISKPQSEQGFQVTILDSAARIIAYPDPDRLLRPASDLLPEGFLSSLAGDVHSHIAIAPTGEERLYTHAHIANANWEVIVSRPTAQAYATQGSLHRIILIATGTFILIGLFFWGVLTVRVIQPIERLAPISEAIGLNQVIGTKEREHLESQGRRQDQIGHLIRSIVRMKDSIAERMKEQATLLETSTAVVSTLDLEAVLNRILEQMGRLLAIQMYAIIALDREQGSFRIRASRGLSRQFTERLTILPTEPDSVTMRALNTKEPIQVSDTETDPSYTVRRLRSRSEGYRAVLAVPLNTQYAPPTALLVFHPTPHVFTQNEIQLMVNFANHAAMAIENAILYERSDMRLQEQTSRLEALVQSLHDGLILCDLEQKVVYANRRIGDLANLPAQELTGLSVNHILASIIARSIDHEKEKEVARTIHARRGERKAEITLAEDGHITYVRLETFDVSDARGESIGRGLILHDITADRELDRMRSSLVSTVSHELRTPLAAIKGYASTLLADDVEWDRASQNEFLTIISEESDRLTDLVNNLLDLSRIEAGVLRLEREECDLEEIIQSAVKHSQLQAETRIEISIEPDLPALHADPPRLESVLRNLIENAVKYSGENAAIQVELKKQGANILFRVSDNGPGIPLQERQHIFKSFYRLDDSLTRLESGAGLGLAICQGLVRAHGGEIWVESQATGACIAFTIPLKSKSAVRPVPPREIST